MKTETSLGRRKNWKERLPLTGYKFRIILQSGETKRFPWAILKADNKYLHVSKISKGRLPNSYPIIPSTEELPISMILKIFYKEEEREDELCLL